MEDAWVKRRVGDSVGMGLFRQDLVKGRITKIYVPSHS
jgi:hypothetical protein